MLPDEIVLPDLEVLRVVVLHFIRCVPISVVIIMKLFVVARNWKWHVLSIKMLVRGIPPLDSFVVVFKLVPVIARSKELTVFDRGFDSHLQHKGWCTRFFCLYAVQVLLQIFDQGFVLPDVGYQMEARGLSCNSLKIVYFLVSKKGPKHALKTKYDRNTF
jgi:hypothetical protein